MTINDLPAVNATLNGLSAIFLGAGYVCIKKKNIPAHRNCMISAFITSRYFSGLLSHLPLSSSIDVTDFTTRPGFGRFIWPFLLTHTILAVVIVPLIFMTLSRALRERFDRHKPSPAGPGRCGCTFP